VSPALTNLVYLLAAVSFILAFTGLSHPRTAVRGNLIGAVGMFFAVVVTLFDKHILGFTAIFAGILVGGAIGAVLATRVKMTGMPEMVALLNGFGGGASVLVAGGALMEPPGALSDAPLLQTAIATALSGLIGSVTFFGSLVAFAKLAELKFVKDVRFAGQQIINALLFTGALALAVHVVLDTSAIGYYWGLAAVAAVLGILLTIPIGGANMPIVICLLNSYSGLAAAATGFVLNNNGLIIAGSLVGAHPDHVQGYEPVDDQRGLRRRRRGLGRERRRRLRREGEIDEPGGGGDAPRRGESRRHRSRLRTRRLAGAARGA
jgi:NAD(P) transhydrogenase subunit beta